VQKIGHSNPRSLFAQRSPTQKPGPEFLQPSQLSDGLNMESETIVADTINGKKQAGETPFCFAATDKRGAVIVVEKLAHIKVAAAPVEQAR
jgi:hypothetical protein